MVKVVKNHGQDGLGQGIQESWQIWSKITKENVLERVQRMTT